MQILPFDPAYLPDAAACFVANLTQLRAAVPALSDRLTDPRAVQERLAAIMAANGGLMALDDGALVGFLGWWLVEDFRGAERKVAYCPEWAHGATDGRKAAVYRALYRAAAETWAAAGCQAHAITLLAHDRAALETWFWNGFGLLVVDAVRPMCGLYRNPADCGALQLRAAMADDAPALVELDAAHCQHYGAAPIFMALRQGETADDWASFLARPCNRVWLALDGAAPVGFMRFDGHEFDGAAVVVSESAIKISGAYVAPAYRGRSAATGLLDAGLRDYASQGFATCAVDFESFNPEAAAFWPRTFQPVCFSLYRVPEATVGTGAPPRVN